MLPVVGVTGRACVGRDNVAVEPLDPCRVTDAPGLKLHDEPEGNPVHESAIAELNSGRGVNCTLYVAVAPACGIFWFVGLTNIVKSDISAETDVCDSTIFPGAS